jgi:hypothetical protein
MEEQKVNGDKEEHGYKVNQPEEIKLYGKKLNLSGDASFLRWKSYSANSHVIQENTGASLLRK